MNFLNTFYGKCIPWVVGGRVDMFNVQTEQMISGIFIKHVLEDSPAGRNGTLKTGDRILEVSCTLSIRSMYSDIYKSMFDR
jgi:C-terminal processing protease CtpA/Prc